LSGNVPSFLGALPQLRQLTIRHNHYTFDGLETLVQNNNLNKLIYDRERIIDLHQNNNTLSVYAGGTLSNNTYKWFKDGALVSTIIGDATFTPISSGAYNVEVSNSIATQLILYSDTVTFSSIIASQQNNISSLQTVDKAYFSVYPNPATSNTTVSFNAKGKYTIVVTDFSGKILMSKTGISSAAKNTFQLDVSRFASGMYNIIITDENNNRQRLKLNKQ
jgi:hypothetical protein